MSAPVRPGLLVSVRSAAEAEAALAGGADLIDVKEPSRGSLGRADDAVIEEVIRVVAGRKPVSAAMGDMREFVRPFAGAGLTYQKWGFAGGSMDGRNDLNRMFTRILDDVESWDAVAGAYEQFALVAYGDWGRAHAPSPDAIRGIAHGGCGVFVLDTYLKDGSTLLDWIPLHQIALLTKLCHNDGVKIALAGSLGPKEIKPLVHLKPDWFAVRGAACSGGREGTVDVEKVRELKALLV